MKTLSKQALIEAYDNKHCSDVILCTTRDDSWFKLQKLGNDEYALLCEYNGKYFSNLDMYNDDLRVSHNADSPLDITRITAKVTTYTSLFPEELEY